MASGNEFHMPGAYHFDSGPAHAHPLSAGIFRPPISPSASSYNLGKSTGSLYSDISMSTTPVHATGTTKRKRMSPRESTPVDWNMNMDGADEKALGRAAAGRQIRYTLAGQINATPAAAPNGAENGILEESVYSDVDYRRALGPRDGLDELESPSTRIAPVNTIAEQPRSPRSLGWSSFAISTIGEVVGRVLEFCKNGVFRGFHAGGGDGYDINASGATRTEKVWCNEHDVPTLQDEQFQPAPTPFQFQPQQDQPLFPAFPPRPPQSPDYDVLSVPDSTPRPAIKRRQVSENDELRRNWVMVDDDDDKPRIFGVPISSAPAPRPSLTRTRNSAGGYHSKTAASTGRRINVPPSRGSVHPRTSLASVRVSHAGSPQLATREPASTASFAQQRSPVSYASPSRIPIPVASQATPSPTHHGTPNRFGFIPHQPGLSSRPVSRPSSRQSRAALGASMTSPTSRGHRHSTSASVAIPTARRMTTAGIIDVNDIQASPRLTDEAKELAQRKLAAERDADARVDAFNAHILDMIRQGKEALGTTVEVLDDGGGMGGGGGWEDDD